MERYEGKPFLRLLECYVLAAIAQLPDEMHNALKTMEPKLRETYGDSNDWRSIVASQMDFSADVPAQINRVWSGYLEHARQQGLAADPQKFAMQLVDANFAE